MAPLASGIVFMAVVVMFILPSIASCSLTTKGLEAGTAEQIVFTVTFPEYSR